MKIVIDVKECGKCPCRREATTNTNTKVFLCMAFGRILNFNSPTYFSDITFERCKECIEAEIDLEGEE